MSEASYEERKAFLGAFTDLFLPKLGKPEDHPLLFVENLEQKSRASASRSVDMALADLVEMTKDWPIEQVASADAALIEKGAPRLSRIRRLYLRKYVNILKRGEIKSEVDYFLVRGILETDESADASERERVQEMMNAFKEKQARSKRSI